MSDEDKSQKTEDASDQRLDEARKKGDVPSSKEVGVMISVFSMMVISVFLMPIIGPRFSLLIGDFIGSVGRFDVGVGYSGVQDAKEIFGAFLWTVVIMFAPVFMVMMMAAIFGVMLQGETVVSSERIRPKLSNISPASGFKRIVSVDNLIEFTKSMVKVSLVAAVGYVIMRNAIRSMAAGPDFLPEEILPYLASDVSMLLVVVASFLIPLAIFDVIYKRMKWLNKQKMSLKEVRDEHKDSEGDPQMKAKRQEKRQELSRKRLIETVPQSTIILTNPTHYAVALKYVVGVDPAPICMAKGVDTKALKIREIARENEIPIVENRPLARALHAKIDVGDIVPIEHWEAVAEIVGYLQDLQNNIKRKPPTDTELRED
jgi:flagellar biosynthetic protein FlhB